MEKIEHVRGSIRQLSAEAKVAQQEGDVACLQVLIDRMHALEEEEEEISWGDFEDPRSPGVELPYDELDYDDRKIEILVSNPTSGRGACVVERGARGSPSDKHGWHIRWAFERGCVRLLAERKSDRERVLEFALLV
jgi:hypothetical protein